MGSAKNFLAQFNNMLANPAIADPDEFSWTGAELRKLVETINDDLDELDEAVQAMKANPKQFRVCTFATRTCDVAKQSYVYHRFLTLQSLYSPRRSSPYKRSAREKCLCETRG